MNTLTMIPAGHAGRTRRSAAHPARPTRGAHEPVRGVGHRARLIA